MRRPAREAARVLAAVLTVAAAAAAGAAPLDPFGGGRLVAYLPRGWEPGARRAPGPASLRIDADELFRRGFRAITTPASTRALLPVCRMFKRRGFRTVLIGVSDPRDAAELRTAGKQRRCADGYLVGSGGLAARRYARPQLEAAVRRLRAATGRPVGVREAFASFVADPTLASLGDAVFASANPFAAGEKHPATACAWSTQRYRDLAGRAPPGVPVVLAETAFATAGEPVAREDYQRAFFLCVETRAVRFEFFEVFDQPWRAGAAAHQGLLRSDGTPKMLAREWAPARITLSRAGTWARGRLRNASPELYAVVPYVRRARWEPGPPVPVSRRGKWKARVGAGGEVAAVLVPRDQVPRDAVDRLPQLDGARVFAVAVGPPR